MRAVLRHTAGVGVQLCDAGRGPEAAYAAARGAAAIAEWARQCSRNGYMSSRLLGAWRTVLLWTTAVDAAVGPTAGPASAGSDTRLGDAVYHIPGTTWRYIALVKVTERQDELPETAGEEGDETGVPFTYPTVNGRRCQ